MESIKKNIKKLIIAYEPVWAIGKGNKAISSHELHQMIIFIKKNLVQIYGHDKGMKVPIIYGGSIDSENAREIIKEGEADGLLVGRNSLNPVEFAKIINEVSKR